MRDVPIRQTCKQAPCTRWRDWWADAAPDGFYCWEHPSTDAGGSGDYVGQPFESTTENRPWVSPFACTGCGYNRDRPWEPCPKCDPRKCQAGLHSQDYLGPCNDCYPVRIDCASTNCGAWAIPENAAPYDIWACATHRHLRQEKTVTQDVALLPREIARFVAFLDTAKDLAVKKATDYGGVENPYENLRSSAKFGLPPWIAVAIRMEDKMARIRTAARQVLSGKEVTMANESLDDAFADMLGYAGIARVLLEEESAA